MDGQGVHLLRPLGCVCVGRRSSRPSSVTVSSSNWSNIADQMPGSRNIFMSKDAHSKKQHLSPIHLPKSAYPHPGGGYVIQHITEPDDRGRRLRVRGHVKAEPDPKRIAEVIIAVALKQARTMIRSMDARGRGPTFVVVGTTSSLPPKLPGGYSDWSRSDRLPRSTISPDRKAWPRSRPVRPARTSFADGSLDARDGWRPCSG